MMIAADSTPSSKHMLVEGFLILSSPFPFEVKSTNVLNHQNVHQQHQQVDRRNDYAISAVNHSEITIN